MSASFWPPPLLCTRSACHLGRLPLPTLTGGPWHQFSSLRGGHIQQRCAQMPKRWVERANICRCYRATVPKVLDDFLSRRWSQNYEHKSCMQLASISQFNKTSKTSHSLTSLAVEELSSPTEPTAQKERLFTYQKLIGWSIWLLPLVVTQQAQAPSALRPEEELK